MEQNLCQVCGHPFDTGAILLNRTLRQTLDMHTVTGWGLCKDDKARYEQGFVALVECDPAKSNIVANKSGPGDAYRTGKLIHVKREAFQGIFQRPAPGPLAFVEPGVIDQIIERYRKETGEEPGTC
jgi:hypothetical protein